ncbi:MAG: GNAT family N-acetyltransferase [Gammaproteobacteria bacterium]
MQIAESERLILREMVSSDAAFFCGLLNEPSWLQNIGDRGVRTPEDAERFIHDKIREAYKAHGFGMYVVESKQHRRPIGTCGLVRRETLPSADLGFALLPEFWGQGFAFEAASAVMAYAHEVLRLPPLLAIVSPQNSRSSRLLVKLGFEYQRLIRLTPGSEELKLYAAMERSTSTTRPVS